MRLKRNRDGIYLRGKTYWLQWRGVRQSLRVQDPKLAEIAAADIKRRAVDPTYAAAHETSVEAVCKAFLEWLPTAGNRKKPPAAGTLEMYGYHVGHFVRIFGGDRAIAEIDSNAVDEYIKQRRSETIGKSGTKTVSAHTVAKEIWTLRKVLTLAARRGWYHRPLEQVLPESTPVEYKPIERSLTEDQIPTLLGAFGEREDRAATCAYLIGLGADWCAVERARAEDFDMAAGLVMVKGTKNARRWAKVPIVGVFAPLVKRALRYLKEHERFPSWDNPTRDMALACEKAGLPRVTPRDLRRTHGEVLRARGVPPHLIGGMLRQADGRMAERVYGRLGPADLGHLVKAAAGRKKKSTGPKKQRSASGTESSQSDAEI